MNHVYEETFFCKDDSIGRLSRRLKDLETSKSEILSKVKPKRVYTGAGPGGFNHLYFFKDFLIVSSFAMQHLSCF